jgi:hypothetical protein
MASVLRYTPQGVPYGPLAAAKARGLDFTAAPDATLPRDAQPTLTHASGCVRSRCLSLSRARAACKPRAAARADRGGGGSGAMRAAAGAQQRAPTAETLFAAASVARRRLRALRRAACASARVSSRILQPRHAAAASHSRSARF